MASNSDGAEVPAPRHDIAGKAPETVYMQRSDMDSLDSVFKRMSIRETFPGSKNIFKAINSDYFAIPPKSVVVCMKTDIVEDILFCIRFGWMTNNEACSKRMAKIWNERDGERVFLMFSVKASKQFCALAEMVEQVDFDAEIDGWSKPNCKGVLRTLFHYVKNVPFSVINHLHHQANGQPVANMWNSMVYNDGNGLEVIKHYVEHPVYASILALEPGCEFFSTARLLLPSSGNSSYSASSYTSQNNKLHDPRSIINPNHGSANGFNKAHKDRDLSGSWRSKDSSPGNADKAKATDIRTKDDVDSTPHSAVGRTPGAEAFQSGAPPFPMPSQPTPRRSDTFAAQDNQAPATSQAKAKNNIGSANHAPLPSPGPGSYQARGGFGASRGGFGRGSGRGFRTGPPAQINTEWRGGARGGFSGSLRGSYSPHILHTQSQGYHNMPSPGFAQATPPHSAGNAFAGHQQHVDPYSMSMQEFLDKTGISTSIQASLSRGIDPLSDQGRGQGSPAMHNDRQIQVQHGQSGKPTPQTAQPILEGTRFDGYTNNEFAEARRESPMKHYRSMPDFSQTPNTRLQASAPDFVPHSASQAAFPSGSRDKAPQKTPTHRKSTALQRVKPVSDAAPQSPFLDEDAIVRMSPARQVEYYSVVEKMAVRMRESAEIRAQLASFKNDVARGDLASSTAESPPSMSPSTLARLRSSLDAHSAVTTSSIEVQNIEQFVGRDGNPLRSVSARRHRKPTDIGHRRGNAESFTSSFDARITRQALDIVDDSPTKSQAMRDARYNQQDADNEDRGRRRSVRFISPPVMGALRSSPVGSSSPPVSARSTDSYGFAETILSYPGSDDHLNEQAGYRSRSTESHSSYGGVPLDERKHK